MDREYGVGRDRVNPLVRKPCTGLDGKPNVQREAVELKVRRRGQGNPLRDGLSQLDEYLSRLSLDTGILIIFDRRPSAPPDRLTHAEHAHPAAPCWASKPDPRCGQSTPASADLTFYEQPGCFRE